MIRAGFGPYFAQPVYNRLLAWLGHDGAARGIADAFARGDRAGVAAAFTDPIVDGVGLVGSPDTIRRRLEEYAAVGVDVGALNIIGDAATVYAGLKQLAPAGRANS
jgi:alkanesulfonate monooxygenase SsuD/methylene tetrahydromethanopterin reductase-like flavin-dependent oxidoreductase (luciferase family)